MIGSRWYSAAWGWLLALSLPVVGAAEPPTAGSAAGKACTAARKPNGDLASAERLQSEFCRAGQTSADARDVYHWTLTATEAASLWTLTIEALPGQAGRLEFFELISAAASQNLRGAPLRFSLQMAPGSPVLHSPPLLLHPGSYAVAVSGIGGDLLYRLRARAAAPLPATQTGPGSDEFHRTLKTGTTATEIPWQLSAAAAGQRQILSLQGPPGSPVPLTLRDAKGQDIISSSVQDPVGTQRLADLGLAPGAYRIVVAAHPAETFVLTAAAESARARDFAEEPDNDAAHAHALAAGATARGRLIPLTSDSDTDLYRFEVDKAHSGQSVDFIARSLSDGELQLDLRDAADQQSLAAVRASHEARLAAMTLQPGRYFLRVSGALGANQPYTLEAHAGATQAVAVATEPNNTPAQANHVTPGTNLTGSLSAADPRAYVSIDVPGGLELWNIEVLGAGVSEITLLNSTGGTLADARPAAGSSVLKFTRLLLSKGSHLLLIQGDRGSWLLHAENFGAPKPGDEVEPNDTIATALSLTSGTENHGWLDHGNDVDDYSFYLPAEQHVTVTLSAPADFPVSATLDWGGRLDRFAHFVTAPGAGGLQRATWTGLLPPGDYFVHIVANSGDTSAYPYTLRVDPAPYFQSTADLEPNDAAWQARPLPDSQRLDGELLPNDTDWFRLPAQAANSNLQITPAGVPNSGIEVYIARPRAGASLSDLDRVGSVTLNSKSTPQTVPIPAGTPLYMRLSGGPGPYHLALAFDDRHPAVAGSAPLSAVLTFSARNVAAFLPRTQDLSGRLHLQSKATSSLTPSSRWCGLAMKDGALAGCPRKSRSPQAALWICPSCCTWPRTPATIGP